jgi:hypothetical protein
VLITSSSWNWRQAETHTISAVTDDANASTTTLTLAGNLTHAHWSRTLGFGTAEHVDMRTEVGGPHCTQPSSTHAQRTQGPHKTRAAHSHARTHTRARASRSPLTL